MSYVTTNIRIHEEDYLRLKAEAARKRKSLSAIIRERITKKPKASSKTEVEEIMKTLDKLAYENSKQAPPGFDSVKALREIRYQDK